MLDWGYIQDRIAEPSTKRGIVMALTGMFTFINQEQAAEIVAFGISVVGLIGMLTKDKPDE